MEFIFYIAAGVSLVATIMTVTRRNAVHALLYLVVSLLSVALVFYVIGAPFIAALEVIIYAGAIMVLFIFVMMMLNLGKAAENQERQWSKPSVFVGPVILSVILAVCFIYLLSYVNSEDTGQFVVGPTDVGLSMFTTYLLGAELAGILILTGLIGAFHLGRMSEREEAKTKEMHFTEKIEGKGLVS